MAGNAKSYVDQSLTRVNDTINTLQQALGSVEKQDNKSKIQQAISALSTAQQHLSGYRD